MVVGMAVMVCGGGVGSDMVVVVVVTGGNRDGVDNDGWVGGGRNSYGDGFGCAGGDSDVIDMVAIVVW